MFLWVLLRAQRRRYISINLEVKAQSPRRSSLMRNQYPPLALDPTGMPTYIIKILDGFQGILRRFPLVMYSGAIVVL